MNQSSEPIECNWKDPNAIRRWLLSLPQERVASFRRESVSVVDADHPLGEELAWAAVMGSRQNTDYENVRRRLRLALRLAGMRPSKAAVAAGVDEGKLSKFLNGKDAKALSSKRLNDLASRIGVSGAWILDGRCSTGQISTESHQIGNSVMFQGYSLGPKWGALTPLFGYRAAVEVLEQLSSVLIGLIKNGVIRKGPKGLPEYEGRDSYDPGFWCRFLLAIHDGAISVGEKREIVRLETGIWLEELPGIPMVLGTYMSWLALAAQSKLEDEKVSLVVSRRQLRWLYNRAREFSKRRDMDEKEIELLRRLIPLMNTALTAPAQSDG